MSPDLTDSVITLRPFNREDLPALYAATQESLKMLCAWMTWCTPAYSIDDCCAFLSQTSVEWENDKSYNFAIINAHDDALIGSIALNQIHRTHNSANVGYWVRQSQARRGLASRALRLVTRFGFEELRLDRLEIVVPQGNVASQRVAQKVGAKFEGILRRKLVLNGESHDAIIYALVRP